MHHQEPKSPVMVTCMASQRDHWMALQDHIRRVDLVQLLPHLPSRWTSKSSKVWKISSSFTAFFFVFFVSLSIAKHGIALLAESEKKLMGIHLTIYTFICYK